MARPQIVCYVDRVNGVNGARRALNDAAVTIIDKDSEAAFDIYDSDAGGSPLTPPFTTDDLGLVVHSSSTTLYADRPRQAVVTAESGAFTKEIELPLLQGQDLGGRVLDKAELTTSPTSTATFTTWTDIAGMEVTGDGEGRPLTVSFNAAEVNNSGAATKTLVAIREGSTIIKMGVITNPSAGNGASLHIERTLDASVGSRTFKLSLTRVAATGTAVIGADTGTLYGPAELVLRLG